MRILKTAVLALCAVLLVSSAGFAADTVKIGDRTVRAKNIGRDFMAGLKNIVGGELKGYTELLQEARKQALDRMSAQAQAMGANAVVNIRFSTSAVAQGAAELYAYGTAVRVEPDYNG